MTVEDMSCKRSEHHTQGAPDCRRASRAGPLLPWTNLPLGFWRIWPKPWFCGLLTTGYCEPRLWGSYSEHGFGLKTGPSRTQSHHTRLWDVMMFPIMYFRFPVACHFVDGSYPFDPTVNVHHVRKSLNPKRSSHLDPRVGNGSIAFCAFTPKSQAKGRSKLKLP